MCTSLGEPAGMGMDEPPPFEMLFNVVNSNDRRTSFFCAFISSFSEAEANVGYVFISCVNPVGNIN